jgi:hypothetical protein
MARLRAGAPPSAEERALFAELRDNLVSLASLLPPQVLLAPAPPRGQTFVATTRAMGTPIARPRLRQAAPR